ncbi:hypothetical protein DB346_03450 [Verrucomicrobia bacterium LW23]|nr:hypothetical protein DB346_03450 [Verrucomicrobia bacterium LW23]
MGLRISPAFPSATRGLAALAGRAAALLFFSMLALLVSLPAPALLADNRVEVTFESVPAGFEVQWRSSADTGAPLKLGVTPCKAKVPPGWQTFRFYKPGWPVLKKEASVRPGKAEENKVTFRRGYGTAVVTARPGVAKVFCDGKSVGETPLKLDLPEGVHRLNLRYPGWEDMNETVIIRENANSTSDVTFPHTEANFACDVPDSEILLDGESLGKAPILNKIVKAGERSIKVLPGVPGLPPFVQRITVPNRPKARYLFRIPRAELRLTGSPPGAEVVDKATGQSLGMIPLTLDYLPPGRRTLIISRPGYWAREMTLTLRDGGKAKAHAELQRSAAVAGQSFFLRCGIEFVYAWRGTWVSKYPLDEKALAEIEAEQKAGKIPAQYQFGPLTNNEWRGLAPARMQESLVQAGQGFMANIMYFRVPGQSALTPPQVPPPYAAISTELPEVQGTGGSDTSPPTTGQPEPDAADPASGPDLSATATPAQQPAPSPTPPEGTAVTNAEPEGQPPGAQFAMQLPAAAGTNGPASTPAPTVIPVPEAQTAQATFQPIPPAGGLSGVAATIGPANAAGATPPLGPSYKTMRGAVPGLIFYPGLLVERVLPSGRETQGLEAADAAWGISADEKTLIYFDAGSATPQARDLPHIRVRLKMTTGRR